MKHRTRNDQGFGLARVLWGLLLVSVVIGGVILWRAQQASSPSVVETSNETQAESGEQPAVSEKKGTFSGVAPKTGSGSVSLAMGADGAYVVQLGEDFVVQDGPDLYVGFGNNGEVDHSTLFSELREFSGKQEHRVPDVIDAAKYDQIIIYCKEFSVVFSVASLR